MQQKPKITNKNTKSNQSIINKLVQNSNPSKQIQKPQISSKSQNRSPIKSFPEKSISDLSGNITVFFEDEDMRLMSLPTIRGIIEAATSLSLHQNIKCVIEGRKKRRRFFKEDSRSYIEAIDTSIKQSQNILEIQIQSIINSISLTFDEFMNSVVLWTERGFFHQIDKIYSKAHQELSECVDSDSRVGMETYKEILERKLQILSANRTFVETYLKIAQAISEATPPIIINTILNDFIYEEYSLEEEDLVWTSIEIDRGSHADIVSLENELEIVIGEFSESFATIDSLEFYKSENF